MFSDHNQRKTEISNKTDTIHTLGEFKGILNIDEGI